MPNDDKDYLPEPLHEAERKIASLLWPELADHAKLVEVSFNLISRILMLAPTLPLREVSVSRRVVTSLLIRVSNDIHCTAKLALQGYPLQALSLASTAYEAAICVAAIGGDDTLAEKWAEHSDPKRSFMPVRELIKQAFTNLRLSTNRASITSEYAIYSQLCLAKHANPILQMQYGFALESNNVLSFNGPDNSEYSVRAAWFAMEHGIRLSNIAIVGFFENHLPQNAHIVVIDDILELGRQREMLHQRALERWGNENPFPDQWS